jgi:hypothetical protein
MDADENAPLRAFGAGLLGVLKGKPAILKVEWIRYFPILYKRGTLFFVSLW